ncbi:hypothetical protein [Bradyrhizobium elkanii]|uniref:Uncharacterized protein n=1 Tax=Bradyrhizobium elkanii TaxID=29448 RepID=A0ABV4FAE8_BRAEL|nr:hypothetical protein [Bradyrhizobium elkanii]MCP1752010.1 hypothetical protein [Bradyrhizobium elkanii]MCP1977781.1 hypothetical protein [Bradyrhizobium elkanii]MCS3887702.1 hypothetical protein [Bradyrhizobium elkanii]MCS4213279.1 hypothetical protein [Bradyrhizobium elkanii]MCW2213586.1 hypothetical protein [Bradyrhizobium elkanii]
MSFVERREISRREDDDKNMSRRVKRAADQNRRPEGFFLGDGVAN